MLGTWNHEFIISMLVLSVTVYEFRDVLQLICTVTPASSNLEETHNTLKFASRAKRVEIFASRNRVNI